MKKLGLTAIGAMMAGWRSALAAPNMRPNVLLICVDDLRPVMGCYGGRAITPNIDRFAKTATLFENHYVQWPVCGPSRSVLTGGVRPDTSGIYGNGQWAKIAADPDKRPTLPLCFRDNGYTTLGFGKIYHGSGGVEGCGWSKPPEKAPNAWMCYVDFKARRSRKGEPKHWRPVYEIFDDNEERHTDFQNVNKALAALDKHRDDPFFIAVGFYKPHLPFVAPRPFWDIYDGADVAPLTPLSLPEGAVDFMYNYSEIYSYGVEPGKLFTRDNRPTPEHARDMTRAYYACVSYTDHHIGRLLTRLDELGLAESTAVVIWGDHGFHLGDQARWAKHTQFEGAMRSPLMVRLPGRQRPGVKTRALVETVDIYPSLVDYCGLEPPEHLEGKSFVPVVEASANIVKHAAYGQIAPVGGDHKDVMAYTVRTDNFRYVEWRDRARDLAVVRRELYDYRKNRQETRNIIGESEYAGIVAQHARLMPAGFATLRKKRP